VANLLISSAQNILRSSALFLGCRLLQYSSILFRSFLKKVEMTSFFFFSFSNIVGEDIHDVLDKEEREEKRRFICCQKRKHYSTAAAGIII
jgi:hypothetical protein